MTKSIIGLPLKINGKSTDVYNNKNFEIHLHECCHFCEQLQTHIG